MTLKRSDDSGASWETVTVIDRGPSAYSVAVALSSSTLGVVYERGPYNSISLVTIEVGAPAL